MGRPAKSSRLDILNQPSNSKPTDSFKYFNRLPPELRWSIWKLELKYERLLHVEARSLLGNRGNDPLYPKYGFITRYEIILTEYQPISKLAHVNSESRAIASRFYRVQLPCRYRWKGKEDTRGTFYFNPELDTLEIRGQGFAEFAQDLWARDTRRVGLINLAVTERRFIEMPPEPMPDFSLPHNVLSRIRRVVFRYLGGVERMFLGEPGTSDLMDKLEVYFSRPIMASIPKFDRLSCDPRSSIEPSLKRVYLDCPDPRLVIRRWFKLLGECNVQHSHEVDYRFLVSFGGRNQLRYIEQADAAVDPGLCRRRDANPDITNRGDAVRWVRKEDDIWRELVHEMREEEERESATEVFQEVELPLQPAIGFWLFPIEALGPLPDITGELNRRQSLVPRLSPHRKVDLSGFQPELCLSYLP
ncbi:hypothetical protein ACHAPT_009763 [Fusarium lateritium]